MPDEPRESDAGAGAVGADDWERHWQSYAESAADNPAQAFRRRLITRLLTNVTASSRILDIGSGTGDLAAHLAKAHPSAALLGLELSQSGVALARRKAPHATFLKRDLLTDEPDEDYRSWATHAVCSEVLEHVDEPGALLRRSTHYMAPGCILVITVPGGPMTAYDRHIGHRRHFRPTDLAQVLEGAGFRVLRSTGAGFPLFNVYRVLMKMLGDRLVAVAGASEPAFATRAAMRLFTVVLALDTRLSTRGWQIVAVAQLSSPDGDGVLDSANA